MIKFFIKVPKLLFFKFKGFFSFFLCFYEVVVSGFKLRFFFRQVSDFEIHLLQMFFFQIYLLVDFIDVFLYKASSLIQLTQIFCFIINRFLFNIYELIFLRKWLMNCIWVSISDFYLMFQFIDLISHFFNIQLHLFNL